MPLSALALSSAINAQTIVSHTGAMAYFVAYDADRLADVNVRGWNFVSPKSSSSCDAASKRLQEAQQEKLVTTLKGRWRKNIQALNLATDFDSVFETFESVFRLVEAAGPRALDMTGFEPTNTNGEQLVAALRASYRWRDEVPGWDGALATARQALIMAKIDVDSCLEGLV
jgi:hypothetical protein